MAISTSNMFNSGKKVSRLGFGAMRLPTEKKDGKNIIKKEEATEMLHYAMDQGVNYIDTAYTYIDGQSEPFVGEVLSHGYRDKVQLATKLPVWLVNTREDMDRILDDQLQRLKTDHIDFYLLHALSKDSFHKMRELGYADFLDKAVASGKILYPSFSFHDDANAFLEIVDDYDFKMTQIQLNILDDENQATLNGLYHAAKKGLEIVIMEPLRGGSLANPPQEVLSLYDAFPEKRSPVAWAFRYLYDMPEILTILSGMSTMDQVKDNINIFQSANPNTMSPEEKDLLIKVKQAYLSRIKTACTGCAYCQPCPMNVAIPSIFQGYDNAYMLNHIDGFKWEYNNIIKEEKDAGRCVSCGACEKACPQHLPIIDLLSEIHAQHQ